MTTITPATPLQARAARLRELYDEAVPDTQRAMRLWLYSVPMSHTPESAASLLLSAIEAEQEPDADQPRLWQEWLAQAQRDGIPGREAVRLAFAAVHISRLLFG